MRQTNVEMLVYAAQHASLVETSTASVLGSGGYSVGDLWPSLSRLHCYYDERSLLFNQPSGLVYFFSDDLKSGFGALISPDGPLSFLSHQAANGLIPIAYHSRQEYWGRVPLHAALAAGCTSIEVNVWLSENELLVGYTPETLVRGQNLRSLYLDPLLRMLRENNTPSFNLPSDGNIDDDTAGVFPNEPSQTLVLPINFNSDGERLWPHLIEHLEPLREGGYLTFF
jgi:hypothetical protein